MPTLKALIKNRTLQQLLIFALTQNCLWWLAGSTASTGTPLSTSVKLFLVGYGLFMAAGCFLILRRHFHSTFGPLLVCIAAIFGLFAAPSEGMVQAFSFIICGMLILLCVPKLGLQSIYGLLVFSFLIGVGIPVMLFFLRNHYLATQFLWPLIPLVASYLALFERYFLPTTTDWRLTLITPGILVLSLLSLPLSWRSLLIIVLVGGHWWFQQQLNARYQLITTGIVQVIVGALILI